MLKVTHIQRFSVHDGPGIRTTLFCKGCSLRCFWCHNPETIEPDIRLWRSKERCVACGSCTKQTGLPCADICPAGALSPTGYWMEQDMAVKQLLRDKSHYRRTGGGITFSGGEPLLQSRALQQVMPVRELAGISKAVDTAGNVKWDAFCAVLPFTDLFLYDVKCIDSALHRKGTGVDNDLIQDNLEHLCHTGKNIWIRIPVVPGWNASGHEMEAIAGRLRELSDIPGNGIKRIQLLSFHRFGRGKYEKLGWEYSAGDLMPPSEKEMGEYLSLFREKGLLIAEIGNRLLLQSPEYPGSE